MKKLRNIFFEERKKGKGERWESENSNHSIHPYKQISFSKKEKEGRDKGEKMKIQIKLDSSSWRNIFFEKRKKKEGMKDKKMKSRSANTLTNPFLNRNSN